MSRRRLAVLAAVLVVALALAGCSAGSAMSAAPGAESGPYRDMAMRVPGPAMAGVAMAADMAEAAPHAAPERPDGAMEVAAQKRQMIYTADFFVLVPDIEAARKELARRMEALDAYLERMDGQSVTYKVPAGRFQEALDASETIGEVTNRQVNAQDVTDQLRDLGIRLKNAQDMRDRLAALLQKAESVDDALKIERELQRLTEQIELFKGRLQALEHRVAFSTLSVHFNSPVPQRGVRVEVPFRWVYDVGGDLMQGETGRRALGQLFWWRRVKFNLPPDYVKYYELNYLTRAVSGKGVYIRAQCHGNTDDGTGEFWIGTIRRELTGTRAFSVEDQQTVERPGKKAPAHVLLCSKRMGSVRYSYLLAVVAEGDHVKVFEAWGPQEAFDEDRDALMEAVSTIR